mmetsp:Transcript_65899/g.192786  ORF Transcript_65899/g.192786 Transcript_65899/m.192786 type:complete len:226 (-) Transcript_65899:1051-1728(-)
MSSGGQKTLSAVLTFLTASLKSFTTLQALVALMPLSSHRYLIFPWIMKSSIQLFVASRPVPSSIGAAIEGTELTSKCITFLADVARSNGEEKLSPTPAIAEKGDRARNLTMCWMNLLSNSEPLTKGAPRGSQPGRKAVSLSGKARSGSPTFRVDATTHARSWKSPNTLALYFLTSSRIGFGRDGNFGQASEGKWFFRGARSLGMEFGNRRGYNSHASTLVSLTVR